MIELSKRQIPVYIVVEKRYIPNEEDNVELDDIPEQRIGHPAQQSCDIIADLETAKANKEVEFPEFHYVPDDKQIPIINDDNKYLYNDGSPWRTDDAPKLVGGSIFKTKEEADKFKNNLAWNYRFEVREMLVNERIKLPEDSQYKDLASAPMICIQMIEGEIHPMCINNYGYILNKLGLPYWADAERFTNGKVIIMPLDTFMKEYKIIPRTEEPA